MSRSRVAVIGVAALPMGRWTPRGDALAGGFEHDFLARVARQAMDDAQVSKDDIDTLVLTLPPASTRQLGLATFMVAHLGLRCSGQVSEVIEMGITGGLALDQAANDILLGRASVALVMGVSCDSALPASVGLEQSIRVVGDVDFQSPFGMSPLAWYAMDATRYMHETGVSRADLAQIAVKNRQHAMYNPLAQFREPIALEDVLDQRPIVTPLGLYEVSPRSDGAVCLVLASEDVAREIGAPYVTLSGRGFYHEGYHQIGDRRHDITAFAAARCATQTALDQAGIELADVSLSELYAPCTITEVLVAEAIGLSARGRGSFDAREGVTAIGGLRPINTSGGCLSRGHPPTLTPLYGVLELREQLLGRAGVRQVRNARWGLHSCELGNYNAALVHVLEGPQ